MYQVYDAQAGENIGPFETAEDAMFFIQWAEEVEAPGAEAFELQPLIHPQDYVLDNDLERERMYL
jgi:hypothetical protein